MVLDRRMQYVIEQILPIIWARYLIPVKLTYLPEPTALKFREISPELIDVLSKAIWVQSKIAFHHWVQYLRKYYDRMVSSPKLFVMYVIYACNTMGNNIKDHYERFVTVCSLLVGFGANFHYSGNGEVLKYIPQILAVFYERVLMGQFLDRGGWRRLEKYLLRQEYLSWHDETQIACPNETKTQKVARQLNFAKKVEVAIAASACKEYDADTISEKDVECDLTTCKISDEVMSYFPEKATSSEPKGSKKLKSSATSQPIEDAEVEAHKKVMQGMMGIVERARLANIEKAKQLEGEASGVACSTLPKTKTLILVNNKVKNQESAQKTINQTALQPKSNISCSSNTQSVEKTNEDEKVEKINEEKNNPNLGIVEPAHNPPELAEEAYNDALIMKCDRLKNKEYVQKTIKQKALKIISNISCPSNTQSVEKTNGEAMHPDLGIDKTAHNTPDFTEEANNIKNKQKISEVLEDKPSLDNMKSIEEIDKPITIEPLKDVCVSTTVDRPEHTNQQQTTSEILGENEISNLKSVEEADLRTASNVLEGWGSINNNQNSVDDNIIVVKSEIVDENKSLDNQESIVDISKQKSENQSNEFASTMRLSTEIKDFQFAFKNKENVRVSNDEQFIKRPFIFGDSEVNVGKSCDVPKTPDNARNGATSSSTSTNKAKYKSKREAMNALIKIIDNLAPKIDMFVVLLDSLVWDLKKDS